MLSLLSKSTTRMVGKRNAAALPSMLQFNSIARYNFSTDSGSHDDFAPKHKAVPQGMEDVLKLIESQVKANKVMLYMKGTPSKPQCGFSGQVVRLLNAMGVEFSSVNVMEFPTVREGIKLYSEWPTIPQLYVDGEFVGGCDIVTTMFKEGELEALFKEKNLLE